ncbi:MAG: fimbrillin family protein [Muribaculaceae bacterium]
MKLKLFLIAASAMALATSCSSDSVIQENAEANAIKFSVVADNSSRADEYYCSKASALPSNFHVWAAVEETEASTLKTYFQDEIYKNGTGSVYVIDGDYRYWPDKTAKVSFWAARNYKGFTWGLTQPQMTFEAQADAKDQKDLIYAYTVASRPDDGNSVPMNFRHALSQIVFEARNDNSNLFVEINKVEICKISKSGTYYLPTGDKVTDYKFEDCGQTTTDITNLGEWNSVGSAEEDIITFTTGVFGDKEVAGPATANSTGTVVNLTNDKFGEQVSHVVGGEGLGADDSSNILKHSLLLVPQTVAKLNITEGQAVANGAGAYFLVYCKIRNVAAGDGAKNSTDVYLWGSSGDYKPIAVPVTTADAGFTWKQGKKYIYRFVFNRDGNSGFNPGDSKKVLIPIELNVTVDDFSLASTTDVNDK